MTCDVARCFETDIYFWELKISTEGCESRPCGINSSDPMRWGLSLSGGGFRATLFHLGVVIYLRESGLEKIQEITAVSGGSILAAHLCLHWDTYAGADPETLGDSRAAVEEPATRQIKKLVSEIVQFTTRGVRERILSRWILLTITIVPVLLRFLARLTARPPHTGLFTFLLQRQYRVLFKQTRIGDLTGPNLHLLGTSLTSGKPCSFSYIKDSLGNEETGFNYYKNVAPRDFTFTSIPATELPLALAVAASSAFPPLFSPIRVDDSLLVARNAQISTPEYITDGGVHDNLGLDWLLSNHVDNKNLDLIVVSDAGFVFDSSKLSYAYPLARNLRANEISMRRAADLLETGTSPIQPIRIWIGDVVKARPGERVQAPEIQRGVAQIRTDLDTFTVDEARWLVTHGYEVAKAKLEHIVTAEPSAGPPALGIDAYNSLFTGSGLMRSLPRTGRRMLPFSFRDWAFWAVLGVLVTYSIAVGFGVQRAIKGFSNQAFVAGVAAQKEKDQTSSTKWPPGACAKEQPDESALAETFDSFDDWSQQLDVKSIDFEELVEKGKEKQLRTELKLDGITLALINPKGTFFLIGKGLYFDQTAVLSSQGLLGEYPHTLHITVPSTTAVGIEFGEAIPRSLKLARNLRARFEIAISTGEGFCRILPGGLHFFGVRALVPFTGMSIHMYPSGFALNVSKVFTGTRRPF